MVENPEMKILIEGAFYIYNSTVISRHLIVENRSKIKKWTRFFVSFKGI